MVVSKGMRTPLRMVLAIGLGVFSSYADGIDLSRAEKLYQTTEYQASLKLVLPLPSKNASAYYLMGRNYFMLGELKKATESFEQAVAADPNNAVYFHWLGRAYGRRAETSSPLTAPAYAVKTRQNFEKSVALDPNNAEAVNDLFSYYLEAPGFLGGGLDKAANLAKLIAKLDEAEYHFALAQIAEKRKEYHAAEKELKKAEELAPKQVGRVLDVAKFLAKQGRFEESDAAFARAHKLAPNSPKVWFEEAATYIKYHRKLDEARDLLKRYAASPLTPEDEPREAALRLLRQVSRS
jgi:tetratricopeptide (TPR) repeat protein